jgi:hypothetical protein
MTGFSMDGWTDESLSHNLGTDNVFYVHLRPALLLCYMNIIHGLMIPELKFLISAQPLELRGVHLIDHLIDAMPNFLRERHAAAASSKLSLFHRFPTGIVCSEC